MNNKLTKIEQAIKNISKKALMKQKMPAHNVSSYTSGAKFNFYERTSDYMFTTYIK